MIRPTLRAVLLFAAGIPVAVLVIVMNTDLWPLVLGYIALAMLALLMVVVFKNDITRLLRISGTF